MIFASKKVGSQCYKEALFDIYQMEKCLSVIRYKLTLSLLFVKGGWYFPVVQGWTVSENYYGWVWTVLLFFPETYYPYKLVWWVYNMDLDKV